MSVSRRRFLRSGAMGALSAGLIFRSGLADARPKPHAGHNTQLPDQTAALFNYSRANFEPNVGSIFRTSFGKGHVNLKLVKLTGGLPRFGALKTGQIGDTESFVLAFQGPSNRSAASTIHQLEHSTLGRFDLFMTRSEDRGRIFYTAIVNRLV